MGQGATTALPVWAYFMQRVYADKRLGYNQGTKFAIPAKFNPCETADTINVNGIQEEYF
jgi:transglycosylase